MTEKFYFRISLCEVASVVYGVWRLNQDLFLRTPLGVH